MAVTYLSYAASNSARIEELALQAGMKKGGAAKGELVLAMYELAVCYRNGWGIKKDPVAAQHYYETAANLGDTDAMNEVSWCYMEGFGCKKDKVSHTVAAPAEHAALQLLSRCSALLKARHGPRGRCLECSCSTLKPTCSAAERASSEPYSATM